MFDKRKILGVLFHSQLLHDWYYLFHFIRYFTKLVVSIFAHTKL